MKKEDKEKREKEKKEKVLQSREGKNSCMYAVVSVLVAGLLIFNSYTMRGETADMAGALGLINILFAVLGIKGGIDGIKETDRRYGAAWIGLIVSALVFVVMVLIFLGGLS